MNNFGIGNKHGYIRLSSDSSMNATDSTRDNGKDTMRMAITKLYKVVSNSDKINFDKKDLNKLIDKMNHNDVNYYYIKKQVTT